MRRTAEEAKRRFSDSYNALMTFDYDDLAAMDAEIVDAFDDVSSSEEEGDNEESTRDKELRRFDMPRLANYPSRFPCSLTRLPTKIGQSVWKMHEILLPHFHQLHICYLLATNCPISKSDLSKFEVGHSGYTTQEYVCRWNSYFAISIMANSLYSNCTCY